MAAAKVKLDENLRENSFFKVIFGVQKVLSRPQGS